MSSSTTHDDNDRSTKRAKRSNDEAVESQSETLDSLLSVVISSKGRRSANKNDLPTEHVLHLPPRLTKSAYQTLITTNCAARPWHLEGRFGSRTHAVEKGVTNGIPIIVNHNSMKEKALSSTALHELINTEGVEIVKKKFVRNHRTMQDIPHLDARVHPELEPAGYVLPTIVPKQFEKPSQSTSLFTYAELFGGIGGFGIALDALGGRCVFYSEIDALCRETYSLNFNTPTECTHGDIYKVPDSAFPKELDLLVGGFPCQPFSKLGEQPGFDCHKGRGQLFLEIVRVLKVSRPRSFLLENVPGLLEMKDTFDVIMDAFCGAGYMVKAEVCTARGLTATKRNRLFFVGIRNDLATSKTDGEIIPTQAPSASNYDGSLFQFPYIPDLKLCSHDILDYESLPQSELNILRLSPETFEQLNNNKRWRPHQLAWPNGHCDPLTSHYGNAVGRGESQLVPCCSPYPPRRFSVRECGRIMGFPNSFKFCPIRAEENQGEMAHRKEGYRMLGNAVCPPLIAALAGSILDAAGVETHGDGRVTCDDYWVREGRRIAVELACAALRQAPVPLPAGCIVWADTSETDST